MQATIKPNAFPVRHTVRAEIGREFITIDVPNGWDDVKGITKKVLVYEGREFQYTGWNSDRNEAFFARPISGNLPHGSFK